MNDEGPACAFLRIYLWECLMKDRDPDPFVAIKHLADLIDEMAKGEIKNEPNNGRLAD